MTAAEVGPESGADESRPAAPDAAGELEAELRVILDAVPAMVGYWDLHLRNRFANQAYMEWFGLTPEKIHGRHIREVIGEKLFALNRPFIEGARRGERQDFERIIVDPTGVTRHSSASYVPVWRDGTLRGFVALVSDVTALKNAEAALAADRIFLSTVLEHIPNAAVLVFDRDLRIEQVFGAATIAPLSKTRADYLGRQLQEVATPENRERVGAAAALCLQGERSKLDLERDGRRFEIWFVPMDHGGEAPRRGLSVAYDVTERDNLRERVSRQERLVTIGTLAAGVAHEINNPLAFVTSNLEFALAELRAIDPGSLTPRTAEVIQALADAGQGAERIRTIVRGLRTFAREEDARRPTDVHVAIELAAKMAVHEWRQKATLTMELAPAPPVLASEASLAQLLVNLLVNAAQAFPSADPAANQIVVRTARAGADRVSIEVSDNGPGIPPQVLPRIFDPFFTTKPVGQGTGLGLAICQNLVASLDGELSCDTDPGSGTIFRVLLPVARDAPPAGEPRSTTAPDTHRARVLVVDDEVAILSAVKRLLHAEHEVAGSTDPREALRLMLAAPEGFDIVFCDIMMPHLTGMELYRQVRERHPRLADRFVFITGGIVHDDVRAFLAQVPNAQLEKPFSGIELREVTRRVLRRSGAGS